jgi:uncharacterized protein (DUF2141 family)
MTTYTHIHSAGRRRIALALAALALAVSPLAATAAQGGATVSANGECCGP